jgi:hypothetical protein
MPYVTSVERLAFEKGGREGRREGLREGRQEGLQEGLEQGGRKELLAVITDALEIRFGVAGKRLVPRVRALTALDTLRALSGIAWTAQTLDGVMVQIRLMTRATGERAGRRRSIRRDD